MAQLGGKVAVITGVRGGSRVASMLTMGSRAHYDDAVRPGRRSAQAAPSALARPKGA